MPIGITFIHIFLYNTYKPYRINYFKDICIIRGYWQSKQGQKGGKERQNYENTSGYRIFCIISHMIPIRLIEYFLRQNM